MNAVRYAACRVCAPSRHPQRVSRNQQLRMLAPWLSLGFQVQRVVGQSRTLGATSSDAAEVLRVTENGEN